MDSQYMWKYWYNRDILLFKGYFLHGATNSMGGAFFGQLQIPSIDLEEAGRYEMSFYVYMFCNVSACDNAGDSIKIILNENDNSHVMTIDYDNIGQQRVWNKMNFTFDIEDSNLEV